MESVWERIFKEGGTVFKDSHPEMKSIAALFKRKSCERILDIGCGTGRHTVYLAQNGFEVYGLDSSPTALKYTRDMLSSHDLSAHLTLHDMVSLPYDDDYVDAVICIQVIHHNTMDKIRKTVQEINRVLKMNGLVWITVPISKNEPSTHQKEIEPDTFIPQDGLERGLPHHYFTRQELILLFEEFTVINFHVAPVNHYSLLARKNP
ncbi:MAG: methyltransferase domain-containing protein [Theionarchaea archaeon]|nr:methyltransferase domain-containing protein [Theionarchaea archaeon]